MSTPPWLVLLVTALSAGGCDGGQSVSSASAKEGGMQIQSSAFSPNGTIPKKYTCEGNDISPPLSFSGAPSGTKSFVLLVDDPDAPDPKAPKMTWVHWVVYDIPASAKDLPENAGLAPLGARDGKNSWKRAGYGGPCPPIGRHRYFHKVYALDTLLGDLDAPDEAAVMKAMKGHVLASGELVGTYQKSQ